MSTEFFTRETLAARWGVGERTIDRLRLAGKLPWINISPRASRPIVRFLAQDVHRFEAGQRIAPAAASEEGING
jgi:hypothetical protein